MITEAFGEQLRTAFNDLGANPVHLLFNQWWPHVDDELRERYVTTFLSDPANAAFAADPWFAEPLDLDALAAQPDGSLGRAYHDWIVENDLTAQIAIDYGRFHQRLVESGQLDGMPEPLQHAVLRIFQTHDFLHVLTGYDATGPGEIALQAYCLAQTQFPYFAMWMSVVTTRTAFVDPRTTIGLMDAITDGWQAGRRTDNLLFERWEEQLDQPLTAVRERYGVELSPLAERQQLQRAA